MNRQEHYRQKYRAIQPSWEDSPALYKRLIAARVGSDTRVLDVGCGHTPFLADVYARTPWTYGIDPDPEAVRRNTTVREKVVGRAEKLPFADNSFDLVTMAWVLEHLEHPEIVFQEIHRVLKSGGRVIFLTPNVWNYNIWIIRSIPNALHEFFTRRLYGRQDHDTFPTRYRMNSERKVEALLTRIGYSREQVILNGDPTYISFNEMLFRFACLLERLLEIAARGRLRVHIVGEYTKTERTMLRRAMIANQPAGGIRTPDWGGVGNTCSPTRPGLPSFPGVNRDRVRDQAAV